MVLCQESQLRDTEAAADWLQVAETKGQFHWPKAAGRAVQKEWRGEGCGIWWTQRGGPGTLEESQAALRQANALCP